MGKNALIAMVVTVAGLAAPVHAGTLAVPCGEDTNGDLVINVLDLIEVLLCFGQSDDPPCDTGQDTNGDGAINVLDLINVLLMFGQDCPPPLNNLCDDRAIIFNGLTPYDTTSATTDGSPHPLCFIGAAGQTDHDVWYNYTATCTGQLTVSTCLENGGDASYNNMIVVYDGCDCTMLADEGGVSGALACNQNFGFGCTGTAVDPDGDPLPPSKVEVLVTSGQCYKIRVGGFNPGDQGAGILSIFCSVVDKDICVGAEVITLSNPPVAETVSGGNNTTDGATIDFGAPTCLDHLGGAPVVVSAPGNWYSVIGNGSTLTATTCNARQVYKTAISVYTGGCASLGCIGNDGANITGLLGCIALGGPTIDGSFVTWCSVVGVEYLILVHGANAFEVGPYRLDIISDGIPCSICDVGKTPENEPICGENYVDITNGGCNATENIFFLPITCGQAYCGEYGAFQTTDPDDPKGPLIPHHDTDWYEITIAVNTIFTWKVTGECDTLLGVVGAQGVPDCTDAVFMESLVVGPSQRGEVTTACQSPGTYWFFVSTATNETACLCGSTYTALLTCVEGCIQTFDQCNAADPIFDGLTDFDTVGMTTDGPPHASCEFDGQTYHDVWYEYIATCNGTLTVSTCEEVCLPGMPLMCANADYDTDMVVYDGCICGAGLENPPLGCNDDDPNNDCGGGPGGFKSTLAVPVISGDCYKIRIGGFQEGDFGIGQLLLSCEDCSAGSVVCDPEKTQENEPVCAFFGDVTNGGCNSTAELFITVDCGEEICGSARRSGADRDEDWYQITIAIPQVIEWTVTAEFAPELFVYSGTCGDLVVRAEATGNPCVPATATTLCVTAGTYFLVVRPTLQVTVQCPSTYNASVTCSEPNCAVPASANLCDDRVDLLDGLTPFSTIGATTDGLDTNGLGDCDIFAAGPGIDNDIWFNYTATCTGLLTVSTCNDDDPLTGDSTYDSKIAIYDGCLTAACPYGGNEIGCNDDGLGCAAFSTIATAPVMVGQCYKVRVGGFFTADFGSGTLSVSCE